MMQFKVDPQLPKRCLMRTDIDSKVKWQWMLVYIRLHNTSVCVVDVCDCCVGKAGERNAK